MKLNRRIFAIVLVFVMLLADSGVAAFAENVLTMPSALQIVEEEAFYGSTAIDKVILPDDVKEIRARAFANSTLSEINLPDSLTFIDPSAFDGPDKVTVTANKGSQAYQWAVENGYLPLEANPAGDFDFSVNEEEGTCTVTGYKGNSSGYIVIPSQNADGIPVTAIGDYALFGCQGVTSIIIPDSVITIGECAFRYCVDLKSMIIPEGVTQIGFGAFWDCKALERIEISSSVSSIGNGLFIGCQNLKSIQVASGNNWYTADQHALFSKNKSVLVSYTGGAPMIYTVPPTVLRIGPEAFRYLYNIHRVVISDGAVSIDENAFAHDENLSGVYIPSSVQTIHDEAFWMHSGDLVIYGEAGSYAETYANEHDIPFSAGPMPAVDTETVTAAAQGSFNGHSYMVLDAWKNWYEAKAYCESQNGYLATITTQEEQDYIESLLEQCTKNNYWLGGYRDSEWRWVTDEAFDYALWAYTQPDNCNDQEDKLHIYRNQNPNAICNPGEWNDIRYDGMYPGEEFFGLDDFGFICEWDQ